MIITITGITGFVGQNLSEFLKLKGFVVKNISMRNHWEYPNDTDSLIHLAGKAHDTKNTSAEEEYFKVNRDLTITIFDQFLISETRDFIYFSSVKSVADTVEDVLKEDYIPNPLTSYGKSKLEAEEYLLNQKLPIGKRLFIIRPCMIHGPGNKGNLNLLYQVVKKGLPWPLASFVNQRSFLSIDNLNFMIFQILQNKDVPSGIYNFSDDENLSTNDLVTLIANSIGKKTVLWRINSEIIISLAKIGDFFKLPLNSERLKKLTESYVVSNHKIKEVLNIKQLPVSSTDGLRKTIKSFEE